jgi:integrase/recombinase XerD
VKPEAMWTMMKQLRYRIIRLLENGGIQEEQEKQKLEFLLKTKKWNPYCIRHSSITSDSDFLPEYALKKKVRWSMNSKQGARYIKPRMGNQLKNQILLQDGIITEETITAQRKPAVLTCPRCNLVNASENKYCSSVHCGYPLTQQAYDEIKEAENRNIQTLQKDLNSMRKQMESYKEIFDLFKDPKLLEVLKSN